MLGVNTYTETRVALTLSTGYLFGLGPGTDRIVTNIKGWHSPAAIRRPGKSERLNGHGIHSERGWKDARYPSVSGSYRAPSEAAAARYVDELAAYLADGTEGVLEVDDKHLGRRSARVFLMDLDVGYTGGLEVSFTVNLEAPDPRKFSPMTSQSTGVATPGDGLMFDLFTGGPFTEARRNLSTDPRATRGLPPYQVAGAQTLTPVTGISGIGTTGITTANRVSYAAGAANPGVALLTGLAPGTTYTVSAYIRHETVGAGTSFGFAESGVTAGPAIAATPNVWQRISWTRTATSTNYLGFRTGGATSAGSFLITGLLVEVSPNLGAFFDGDSPSTDGAAYSWSGTANASASVQSVPTGPTGILDFGKAGNLGSITVANTGTAPTEPVFEVAGYAPGFTITEVDTGNRLAYRDVVPLGTSLVLNSRNGTTTTSDGQDRSRGMARAEWSTIPPSSSRTYLFESDGTGALMTVKAAPAWW